MAHLADLHRKLPRHAPADQQAIQDAVALLRGLDLEKLEFPLPGGDRPAGNPMDNRRSTVALGDIQKLLPSWADNISLTYFDHAHTLPDQHRRMTYRIVHKTTYKYKTPVSVGNHVAYLTPRSSPHHICTSHELLITPPPAGVSRASGLFRESGYFLHHPGASSANCT